MKVREVDYFSQDYQTARKEFLDAAFAAGASVDSVKNPHLGPDSQPLFMDVALIGDADAARTLVLISGTHGVEGFAGSSIQTRLLREGIGSRLPGDVSLLMIHGVNPFGMAHLRRFTEDNVDLNRNFRDHDMPYPDNAPYEYLADVIAPRSLSFLCEVISWSRMLLYRITAGKAALQAAVSCGQYLHPGGLFYGGTFDTWSNTTLRTIMRHRLSASASVIVIDIHTGLGGFGAAEVILNVSEDSPVYRRALRIWGSSFVKTTVTGESVSAHLDASLKLAIPQMLPNAEVTAVGLEFGTVPPMQVFKALRGENWLHHHGGQEHHKARQLKERLLRAFHPDSQGWEASVWRQGVQAVECALSSLAGRSL
jgi:predicted deacylase